MLDILKIPRKYLDPIPSVAVMGSFAVILWGYVSGSINNSHSIIIGNFIYVFGGYYIAFLLSILSVARLFTENKHMNAILYLLIALFSFFGLWLCAAIYENA
jgi:hypothetical protein